MAGESIPRVVVFPYYPDNPFSALLLDSVRATGYSVEGTTSVSDFAERVAGLGVGDVVHVQWTAAVTRGLEPAEASRRVAQFRRLCSAALDRGATLIWTVHNVIAHDSRHPEPEIELARYLAEAATAIHVINPSTPQAVAGIYPLPPGKVTTIPHSSYAGVYPVGPGRARARRSFGISNDQRAVLFFGQDRPYKGADILADAVSQLEAGDHEFRLLSSPARIDDDDVARWFAAADVTVLPYRAILNSGTVLLSATFGVPVVVPDLPALRALYQGQAWVHFYPHAEGASGLAAAIAAFVPTASERRSALAFAAAASPRRMSDAFRDLLEAARLIRLERSA